MAKPLTLDPEPIRLCPPILPTFDLGSGTNMAVPSYTPDLGSTPLCLVSGQAVCLLSLDTQGALLTVTTSGSKSQRPEG